MPSYPVSAPSAGPKSRTCDAQPWYRGGERLVFDGLDASMLQGVWAPFYAVPGYAGPLLRARRASDDAEIDVFNWSSLNAFLAGTSGFFAKIYDQSGNGHDAVQAGMANQPAINLLSNGIIEIDPDNSNDWLTATMSISTSETFDFWSVGYAANNNWTNSTHMSGSDGDTELDGFSMNYRNSVEATFVIWTNSGAALEMSKSGLTNNAVNVLTGGRRDNQWLYGSVYHAGRNSITHNFSTVTFNRVELCRYKSAAQNRYANNPCYFFAVCQPGTEGQGNEYDLIASRLWTKLGAAR